MWETVNHDEGYGIAIHNYLESGPFRIKLTVGECVHIFRKCHEWYYGCSNKNKLLLGIFPRSFINIMNPDFRDIMTACNSSVYCTGDIPNARHPHIIAEITSVLREWGAIWKRLYMTRNSNFKTIEHKMYELIRLRSKILSGTIPIDELKQVQCLVAWNIDVGNKVLGLDMVVRDEQGNILNPGDVSAIDLYRHHESATQRISQPYCELLKDLGHQKASQSYNYTLYASVRNLVCKVVEDMELIMVLFDIKQNKPFSENFIVKWSRESFMMGAERYHNFKVLFTDLGSRDLARDKVYLVCYVIRNGGMECEQPNGKNVKSPVWNIDTMRRPYGVACLNLTPYFNETLESDEDKHNFIPILPCEKDTLDTTLKKYIAAKEFPMKESKGQGIILSFKLLKSDIKQVREDNPHLVFGNVAIARKMGFPEVILPGDVRNDLYLTLLHGEFSKGSKSSDKNIQVEVSVCGGKGTPIQGGICLGAGIDPESRYHSVVYYHDDKPRWYETFKVSIPIENFKESHLKFIFRHKSSKSDFKDKPFAFAFAKIMQRNGTTLKDEPHELSVYKVDPKKYDANDTSYLELASNRAELAEGLKIAVPGLMLSNKDFFIIETNVCSTKLTQNVDLLGFLNWTVEPGRVMENLSALMKVGGEEVIKFLQDVLDTLFNILMVNSDSEAHDNMVFKCLLYVIGLVLDRKFLHFQPVLDIYIQESFSATLAHNKLIIVLKHYIENITIVGKDLSMSVMKSLKYVMRFITRSRYLFSQLYEGKGRDQFEGLLKGLLVSVGKMMNHKTDSTLLVQAACLKYLPSAIPDIMVVFCPVQLSFLLLDLINNVPSARLTKQKMMTINDIVHSSLFLLPECRSILLNGILIMAKKLLDSFQEGKFGMERQYKSKSVAKIARVLGANSYDFQPPGENVSQVRLEMELCVKILSDIMDLLFKPKAGSTIDDINEITLTILRTIIQTTIRMDRENVHVSNLASVMISIFRQMTPHHFETYERHFPTKSDLVDFLLDILLVFKDLISRPVFPTDWCEMILLQNSVILKCLRYFSHTIRDNFFAPFEHQVWNNFFHCAVTFLTQPALQLESFSQSKRWRILTRYKDMRRAAGFEVKSLWFNLGQNKMKFIPGLVSPFLEMTLIPEEELRKATIPIFFDMMQCEFYSPRTPCHPFENYNSIKGNFTEFENEMIAKLDNFVEAGSGDEQFKNLFHSIMMNLCENHSSMNDQGGKFVSIVTGLMERLLEYRCIITDENKENRMICTVNLLNFYSDINREEMYIRYVNKLCYLHLESENYTEAAYTLGLHAHLLKWADTPLSPLLRSPKYAHCETHHQLKEALYQDMIAYFDKGKMWENAIAICKELARQYEEETFDFGQLSALLRRMAQLYDCVIKQLRPKPEYFRVAYYGRGFPSFLQNKVFVHRGKEYDRLSDFVTRIMNQHPNAELMSKLTPPSTNILESFGQHIQINHVEPIMDEKRQNLLSKSVNEQIVKYHKVNNIQKFRYSRPLHHSMEETNEASNEFAHLWLERTVVTIAYPLPGILKWFPVTHVQTYAISPLKNAIETMQEANKKMREMVISYKNDYSLPLNPLSMKLNGIVDAAVMGGVSNYEKAFFTPEYAAQHPENVDLINELKDLIASQIPLLDIGIQIHKERAPSSLTPLQQRIEEQFSGMKARTEEKYGSRVCDIKFEGTKLRRHTSVGRSFMPFASSEDRLSQSSTSSNHESKSLRSFVSSSFSTAAATSCRAGNNNSFSSSLATLAPVLSNCNVSPSSLKFGTIGALTRKEKKEKKKRRNRTESKVSLQQDEDAIACAAGNTQWYMLHDRNLSDNVSLSSVNSNTPSYDQKQETKSVKSIPSEIESKICSRPLSSSDCSLDVKDFIDSTTASEDDKMPPPLPVKTRELEAVIPHSDKLSHTETSERSSTPITSSLYSLPIQRIIQHEKVDASQSEVEEEQPPTPPPKKPSHRVTQTPV